MARISLPGAALFHPQRRFPPTSPLPAPIRFQGSPSGYGATVQSKQTDFKVWAPSAKTVDLLILSAPKGKPPDDAWNDLADGHSLQNRIVETIPMQKNGGDFKLSTAKAPPGTLYMYRLDYGDNISKPLPDPYSEAQPEDVHGPSAVVDDHAFTWTDHHWKTPDDPRRLTLYRLHVGTWSPEGNLQAVTAKLHSLKEQGFNAVELFPMAEFPGKHNWGYDPSGLYAVENAYGKPDDLKQLVNEAHRQGMAVILDGVYNHVSVEGQYLKYFDYFFTNNNATQWGPAINWENEKARLFVTDNVKFWMDRYHVDGFRLDSTPDIPDHGLKAIVKSARQANPSAIMMAEDIRNWNAITDPPEKGGVGCNGQWDFCYHHDLQSLMTGNRYKGGTNVVAHWVESIRHGYPYGVQTPRTSLLSAVRYDQSHDEIANDNKGQRNVSLLGGGETGERKAMMASVVKYLLPGIPLNFMGQEYGEKNPFRYFTSSKLNPDGIIHSRPEGEAALNGVAFQTSKLSPPENRKPEYLNLTRDIAALRLELPALWQGDREQMSLKTHPEAPAVAVLHRFGKEQAKDEILALINFSDINYTGEHALPTSLPTGSWREVLNTDALAYGGAGNINAGTSLPEGTQSIQLAPWSIALFHQSNWQKSNL